MSGFVLALWRHKFWIVLGLAVVAAGFGLLQTERLSTSQLKTAQWQENYNGVLDANVTSQDTIQKLQRETKRRAGIADKAVAERDALAIQLSELQKVIVHDQTPVSDDWCAVLDELRRIAGAPGAACSGAQ